MTNPPFSPRRGSVQKLHGTPWCSERQQWPLAPVCSRRWAGGGGGCSTGKGWRSLGCSRETGGRICEGWRQRWGGNRRPWGSGFLFSPSSGCWYPPTGWLQRWPDWLGCLQKGNLLPLPRSPVKANLRHCKVARFSIYYHILLELQLYCLLHEFPELHWRTCSDSEHCCIGLSKNWQCGTLELPKRIKPRTSKF